MTVFVDRSIYLPTECNYLKSDLLTYVLVNKLKKKKNRIAEFFNEFGSITTK